MESLRSLTLLNSVIETIRLISMTITWCSELMISHRVTI